MQGRQACVVGSERSVELCNSSSGVRPNWNLPNGRLALWRDWKAYSAAVFDRGDGVGLWRDSQHRLLVSLTQRPPMDVQVEGGPVRRLAPVPDAVSVCPADVTIRTVSGDSRYIQICWEPELYRTIAPGLPGPPQLEPIASQDPLLGQLARTLADEVRDRTADRLLADCLIAAVALRVVQRFAPGIPRERPDPSSARLRRAVDYIEAHLDRELTLAELAGVACLSPFHFSRCFKRAFGVGPHRYLTQRRVERAKEMVLRSGQSLAAVAQAVGFADQSHFTAAFRRETGTTPGRFREAAR